METMGGIMKVYVFIYFGMSLDRAKVDFSFSLPQYGFAQKMILVLKIPSKSNKIKLHF